MIRRLKYVLQRDFSSNCYNSKFQYELVIIVSLILLNMVPT